MSVGTKIRVANPGARAEVDHTLVWNNNKFDIVDEPKQSTCELGMQVTWDLVDDSYPGPTL
jgi:hypothetical protein